MRTRLLIPILAAIGIANYFIGFYNGEKSVERCIHYQYDNVDDMLNLMLYYQTASEMIDRNRFVWTSIHSERTFWNDYKTLEQKCKVITDSYEDRHPQCIE